MHIAHASALHSSLRLGDFRLDYLPYMYLTRGEYGKVESSALDLNSIMSISNTVIVT